MRRQPLRGATRLRHKLRHVRVVELDHEATEGEAQARRLVL